MPDGNHHHPENLTAPAPADLERIVFRKVMWRLMPFLGLLYFFNILDRANIGYARLQMLDELDISKWVYGLGAGIFSIGYCVLEVPSNLMLSRIGARRWIARILVSWGLISAGMMFVVGPVSFCVMRFLLGCAEAGFFPGIVLYLTYWFPARQRARAVALFMAASPLTWVIGGPLSGALMQYMNGYAGLAGWQWLFLIEGVPSVVLGGVTLFYLTDRPVHARWLNDAEKDWLARELADESFPLKADRASAWRSAMADGRVWILIALAVTIALGISGLGFYFVPLVKDRFGNLGEFRIGQLQAVSGVFTLVSMFVVSAFSDRTGKRRGYIIGLGILAAGGWGLSIWRDVPIASFLGMMLAQAAMMSMWGPFWSLATSFLGTRAAAGGIALINALANLGAFFGPIIMGWSEETNDFAPGLAIMALTMLVSVPLALCVRSNGGEMRNSRAGSG